MSVIIRLQNLPWSANALDIREFFKGLSIPEGGVHIVGGELGDAFIAFSTDEDARLAMRMTGTSLKGIQVTLLLSSRTEMQKVIEAARQRAMALQAFMAPPVIPAQPQQPNAVPVSTQPQQPPQPQPQPQPQVQPQPQAVPAPSQVPPPQMQLPTHSPYQMLGLPPGADGHQPLPPMPPHMPHTPPTTMQQPMQPLPQLSHIQEAAYNNLSNQHENSDSQGALPGSMVPKEEKKDDKKPPSASLSVSSSRRDSKGRDGRRRRSRTRSRSRSRSRDRDRDRHRRHRSRSRSRSRDRSGRSHRRSSRSRERDRFRDKNRDRDRVRDRDRDRERDRSVRIGRDRSERSSLDSNKAAPTNDSQSKDVEVIGGTGGIPGLGEIPSINMRGPLPSSLAEPIRNSPIQTPPGPAPVPVPVPNYTAGGAPFNSGSPFPQQIPFNNMSVPPPIIPVPNPVEAPTDMELIAEDEGSLDQDGPTELQPDIVPEPVVAKPPNEYVGGPVEDPMRVHGEYPPPPRFGSMPGDAPGPQFGNRGPVPLRPPPENFGFEEQPGNFPPPMEAGNGFNQEQHFEPRNRPEPPQRNWPPREESPADASRFRGEREQRDMRGFRGEKEMMNRGPLPMGERDLREGNDMHEMREDNEMHGNWDPRSRTGHIEEFEPGWDGPNRQEGTKESVWNGRSRQGNFHPRNERDVYGGRNDREGWEEQESWGGRDGYPGREQERYGDDGDYDESYNSRGYRGRGGRSWDRGRGWERGRGGRGGFNSRHGEFMEGHHDDGHMPRGGHGGFRGRGPSRWGGQYGEETSCVELHNIPLNASYRAIRELFQNIYVPNSSIKILGDSHGNRTDVAYIRFSQPRDAFKATKFSGKYLYDSKIEITLLSESKYDAEIDVKQLTGNRGYRGAPPEIERNFMNESPCVYVTGLPMGCTDHNVAQVFEKYKIEDIVIERVRGTRQPSGGCFVRLNSFDEAQRAIAELADATIDGSPLLIELCPVSAMAPAVRDRDIILGKVPNDKMDKVQETKKPASNEEPLSDEQPAELPVIKQSITADLLTDSVVVKRVPKDATEANVRDFFSDEGLVPERMHFCEPGTNGVREVYVMFPLIEDAKRAVGKNEQQIGKMKVMVEMIAKPIVMNAMGLSFDPLELIKKGQKSGVGGGPQIKEKPNISQVKIPHEDADGLPDEGEQEQMSKIDHPMEEASMDIPHPNSYDGHRPPFRGRMAGPYPGGRGFVPRGEMRGRGMGGHGRGGMGDFGRMRGPLVRPPAGGAIEDNIGTAIPPENFGKPGCVVALGNLPYRCTTDDILDFLREFPALRPEHIIRRYNELNQPTADARVSFSSPQEAQRAIQTHNRRMMDNRLIFVSLVQK